MFKTPCRVSADLRRHELEQDRAERTFADNAEDRRNEAEDALEEPELLKAVLNDEALAAPLARMFRNLDLAFKGDVPARDAVLQAAQAMKVQCFDWLMDRE